VTAKDWSNTLHFNAVTCQDAFISFWGLASATCDLRRVLCEWQRFNHI